MNFSLKKHVITVAAMGVFLTAMMGHVYSAYNILSKHIFDLSD